MPLAGFIPNRPRHQGGVEGFGVVGGDLVDPEREQPAGGGEAGGVGARHGVGVDPPAGGMEGGDEVEPVVGGEEHELVVEIDELGVRRGGQRVGDEGRVVAAGHQAVDGAHVAGVVADAEAGDAGGEQAHRLGVAGREDEVARHRGERARRRWRRRAG